MVERKTKATMKETLRLLEKTTSALELTRKENEVLGLKLEKSHRPKTEKKEKKKEKKKRTTTTTTTASRGRTPLPETPPFAKKFWSYRNEEKRRLHEEERTHPLRFFVNDVEEEEEEEGRRRRSRRRRRRGGGGGGGLLLGRLLLGRRRRQRRRHHHHLLLLLLLLLRRRRRRRKPPARRRRHQLFLHRRTSRPIRGSELALGSFRTKGEAFSDVVETTRRVVEADGVAPKRTLPRRRGQPVVVHT